MRLKTKTQRRTTAMILLLSLVLSLNLITYPTTTHGQKRSGAENKKQSAPPQIVNGSDPEGGAVLIGQRIAGIIDNNADADVYQFQGVAGESVRIEGNATSGDLDPTVTLFVDPTLKCACQPAQASSSSKSKTRDWREEMDKGDKDEDEDGPGAPASGHPERKKEVEPDAQTFTAVTSQLTPSSFSKGDVLAAVGNGKVKRFSPTGTLLQTLDSGTNSQFVAGMGFNSAGEVFSTQFSGSNVFKFDINGNSLGAFGGGYDAAPESVVFDSAQNVYIGQANGSHVIRKFNSAGVFLDSFAPATEARGTDWIDLAADQRTLFYTSEGKKVKRFDLQTKTQLADLNSTNLPGSFAYALRILPGGGVLVADNETIVRLDSSGSIVQQYDAPGEDVWFAVNLDPDGQTFWSGNLNTGKVYRFNLATGAVVTSWDAGSLTALGGLAVFGEITASQVLSISKSGPPTAKVGDALTYTINFGNSGLANATNVIIRDTVPIGTSFVSATNGGTFASGAVSWNIGTLNAGVTGQTVSFTVRAGAGFGNIVNNNYSIEASGIAPIKGAPVTTAIGQVIFDDNSGGGVNALIKDFQLPFTGLYRVLVASSKGASNGGFELAVLPIDTDSNVAATQVGGASSFPKVWSTKTGGSPILQDSVVSTPVTFQAFSPDGQSVVTQVGGATPFVHLYNTKTGQVIFTDSVVSTPVTFVGFAPDGASVATQVGGPTPSVKVWSTKTPNSLIFQDSIVGTGAVFAGFAPDGASAAVQVGGSNPFVKVWSTRSSNSVIFTDSVVSTPVTFAGFASDGSSVADQVGGTFPFVKVWSTRSNDSVIFSDSVVSTPVTFAGFASDGSAVADQVGGTFPFVKVWSTRSNSNVIFTDSVVSTPVTFVGFAPDGSSAADQVGGTFSFVKVWSTRSSSNLIFNDSVVSTPVAFAGFAPDGASVADQVGGTFPFVKVWSTRSSSNLIFNDSVVSTPVAFAGFAPDGASVADQVGGTFPFVKVWSTRSGNNLIFNDSVVSTPVVFSAFGPDGASAVNQVGGSTGSVKVWSTRSGSLLFQDSIVGAGTAFVGFAPDGASAAVQVGGGTPFVKVWSTRSSNSLIFNDSVVSTPVTFSGFAPDGASVADQVGGATPFVKVWSTRSSSNLVFNDSVVSTPVIFAGFAPDGSSAVDQVGGTFSFVKVWSTRLPSSLTFNDSVVSTPVTFAGFGLDSDEVADQVGGAFPFVKMWSTRTLSSLTFTDSVVSTPVTFAGFSFDRTHGVLPTTPNIDVSSLFLDFTNVAVGQTRDLTLTISNTGNAPLTISSFSQSATQFSVTSPAAPFNIAAGQQQAVNVRFTPTAASLQTGVMAIASSDPNHPGIDVFMVGNGPGCLARPANLVTWYPGDGSADDIQGTNNATLQNGVTFTGGQVGQAFNFNGIANQVLTPAINLGGQFSVEFWLRPTSNAAFQHLVSNGRSSTNYGALYFNNDHLEYWQNGALKVSSFPLPLNTFSHVALTYDGSLAKLYVNSILAGTSGAHAETFNNAVLFGFATQAESNHFAGQLDEVALYSRALPALEIQSIVSASSAGKCKQLAAGPVLDVLPTALDFGSVIVGQTKDLPLTISNTGGSTLSVSSFNFTNLRFTVTSPAAPFNIPASSQQSVTVRFTPTVAASETGTLTINSNDPNSTGQSVLLIGNFGSGPRADYQFQDNRVSCSGTAPPLADLVSPGTSTGNSFISDTVDGSSRTVLSFPANNGLALDPNTGVIANGNYSIVILFKFTQANVSRRIIEFKNGTSNNGLYADSSNSLRFLPNSPATGNELVANAYVQVVLTRDSVSGQVTGYVNGVQRIQFNDTNNDGVVDTNNRLRFFQDNLSGGATGEAAAGAIARIRLFSRVLSSSEVSSLDRLPGSACGSATPTPTPTPTATPTPTPTATPTPTPTATPTPSPAPTPGNVLNDPGLEATNAALTNLFWTSTSTNFTTSLCDSGCGTGGGTAGARSGNFWAWFGGINGPETGTLSQVTTIPKGVSATLNFYLWVGGVSSPFTDVLDIKVDGATQQTFTEPSTAETGYSLRSVNLNAFADGGQHTILFQYVSPTNGGVANFSVDDISLDVAPLPSSIQLSQANYSVTEGAGLTITLTRTGNTANNASVRFATSDTAGNQNCNVINGKASSRCDYIAAIGTISFAPGETSKALSILTIDDAYAEGNETFTVSLNGSSGATLGAQSTATVTLNDNDSSTGANPLEQQRFFTQEHYYDFLGRFPDQAGWDFWTSQITNCGANQSCIDASRVSVSASFFLSIEFQQTGYLVERIYKASYGDAIGTSTFPGAHQLPVPVIRFGEFLPDTQEISNGVIVGQGDWQTQLENNKQAFAAEFVQRSRFTTSFPTTMTPAQFVDKLFLNAGVTPTASERTAAINEFGAAATTPDTAARGRALRQVAEDSTLNTQEFNRAFVLMQYYGYLRRDPNVGQDADYSGYDFWLTKLNQFNGNFINAEMVKAFITSIEYRQRFGP